MSKKALITDITGQDGSYLAEHLAGLGDEVHRLGRRVRSSIRRGASFEDSICSGRISAPKERPEL